MMINHHTALALEKPETFSLPDGALMRVRINLGDSSTNSLEITSRPGVHLPMPVEIACTCRLHVIQTTADARAFALHGQHAIAADITINEEPLTITMVGEPGADGMLLNAQMFAMRTPKRQTRVGTPKPTDKAKKPSAAPSPSRSRKPMQRKRR